MCEHNMAKINDVVILKNKNEITFTAITERDNVIKNDSKVMKLDINNNTEFDKFFQNVLCQTIDLSIIVSINLSHNNLNYLPDGFSSLDIKHLDLSYNNFVNVPYCIQEGLRLLEILDLSHNVLESFENEPKCVKKLRILKINNNRLTNIPTWILVVKCFNLEELYYSYNDITSFRSAKFLRKSSYELRRLELRNSFIRSEDIPYLKMIRSLQHLDLSNDVCDRELNSFSYDQLTSFFDKPRFDDRLRVLNLSNMRFSFIPEEISQLFVLQELYVTDNDIMWLPDSIVRLNELQIVDLSRNKLVSLPNFSKLQKLKVIRMCCNIISRIESLPKDLRTLDLYDNNLEEDSLSKINDTISEIDLDQNFFEIYLENYEERRTALRLTVVEKDLRKSVPKMKPPIDKEELDSAQSDSDEYFVQPTDCSNYDYDKEEIWEDLDNSVRDCDSYDAGCTLSDNEWTGKELTPTTCKIPRQKLEQIPYYLFEDVV